MSHIDDRVQIVLNLAKKEIECDAKYHTAMIRLQSLSLNPDVNSTSRQEPCSHVWRQYMTLLVTCRIHLVSANPSLTGWHRLFQVEDNDIRDVDAKERRQKIAGSFRRLSSIVHPDKNNLRNATETFLLLQQGMNTLLSSLPRIGSDSESTSASRHQQYPGNDSLMDDSEAFAWWTAWDAVWEHSTEIDDSRTMNDIDMLNSQSIDDLSALVTSRQEALFGPIPPGKTLHDLKDDLKRARTVLNEKLSHKRASETGEINSNDGGFLL